MHIETFDSLDDMHASMDKAKSAADRRIHEKQLAVTWGSHYVQPAESYGGLVLIFGYVPTLEEVEAQEMTYAPPIGDKVEYEEFLGEVQGMVHQTIDSHDEHMLFVTAASMLEVEGELGHAHRSVLWPIDADLYAKAKEARWDVNRIPIADTKKLFALLEELRRHAIAVAVRG